MSIFASFTKKSKLDAAVRKTAKARQAEKAEADQLFGEVYQDYADILTGDSLRAAALYHWGFALLHQAKNKQAPESINIYRNAIAKFSFCMTLDPFYLAAAIDAGVACMDLARAMNVPLDDELYIEAIHQFEKANSIQAGMASYNLACMHGLRGKFDDCLEALKTAKEHGSLPDKDVILNDPDMAAVVTQDWFKKFMDSIEEEKRLAKEKAEAEKAALEAQKQAEKERKAKAYDPYRKKEESETKSQDVEAKTESAPEAKAESATSDTTADSSSTPD